MKNPKQRRRKTRTGPGCGTATTNGPILTRTFIQIALIVLLGTIVYWNTLSAPFIFDDEEYIVSNAAVRDLRYFTSQSLVEAAIASKELYSGFRTRVVALFTFALNYRLHGLSVAGYHLFNIAVHIGNALLVYWLVLLTLRTPFFLPVRERLGRRELVGAALFASLFFISHPIQTQAVTYISQRFTSLATFYCLLSLALYVRARLAAPESVSPRPSSPGDQPLALYAGSAAAAVLAMKTKEISFTFPVVIALYEFFFFAGEKKRRLLAVLPLLLTMLIIPLTLLQDKTTRIDIATLSRSLEGGGQENPALNYLFTQFRVIITYLRLLVLPMNQNVDYDYPVYTSFFRPEVYLSFLFLLALGGAAGYLYFRSRRSGDEDRLWQRLIAFGIFWFFIMLSLESSFLPLADVIFEHRLYLPSVGFFLAVVGVLAMAWRRAGPAQRNGILVVLTIVVGLWSAAAYARNGIWGDKTELWADNVRKSPMKARAHANLGMVYAEKGRYKEAVHEYLRAIELKPTFRAYYNLGIAYASQGQTDDAIREYENALQLKPSFAKAHNNLGTVYLDKRNFDKAIEHFETALKLNPNLLETSKNLSLAYKQKNQLYRMNSRN